MFTNKTALLYFNRESKTDKKCALTKRAEWIKPAEPSVNFLALCYNTRELLENTIIHRKDFDC